MSYSEQLKLARIKKQGDEDFYFFCRHILNNDAMASQPHEEVCSFLQNWGKRKKLMLLPRGGFKSTVGTVAYSLKTLTENPNARILIVSANLDNAKTYLKQIKQHIEKNELFKSMYGNLKPSRDGVWRETEIDIATKTESSKSGKEFSVSVAGVGQDRTGMHYDLIILDDIVNKENINTADQIRKTLDYYRLMNSILDPTARMMIIGTRYHFADLYGTILENEEKFYDILVRNCYDGPDGIWFPSRLTKEFLEEIKATQGPSHFANQYLNSPIDAETALFKREWIQFYDKLPDNLRHYVLTDAAISLKEGADFSAILTVGVDESSNIYVVDMVRDRLHPNMFIETIFQKVSEYRVYEQGVVTLETNSMQQIFKHFLTNEMAKRSLYFGIYELKPNSTQSKERKIQALQPWFQQGKIFIADWMNPLVEEIIRFPKSKHDDCIDALSAIVEVIAPPDKQDTDPYEGKGLSENEKWMWDQVKKETRRVKRKKHRL